MTTLIKFHYSRVVVLLVILTCLIACKHKTNNTLFTQLSPEESGIYFSNDIHDNDSSKSFINEFGYMGGGVGIGDFDNDGLKDIFFSANQVSSQLYINKGNNKFQEITKDAGVSTSVWATGVSIVDINNDGYDDIYVCVYGKTLIERAKNLLFINQKNLTFLEEAENYGLADTSYSTQAAFFDYDKDGDLDMFLSNYLIGGNNANYIIPRDTSGRSVANDRLYRNDGDTLKLGHPFFVDVSIQANIKDDGYGLGLSVSDFNNDGWPDVYVANDFISNDNLWINNKNGTFTNCIAKALRHQSYSSMGADAADINNDGLTDIVTLDMLPEYNKRKKESFFFMNYERYQSERLRGYEPEFMRNMLQLNNGNICKNDTCLPFFSEIGQLAGISATDWSWSVLMADFDCDGWKDIHMTNGIGRDFINADFIEFSNQIFASSLDKKEQQKAIKKKLASLDHVKLNNYLYTNNRNYTFSDASERSGIDEASMSNGAAYVDIDNDGDFDLVVNNINKEAFVFVNNTIEEKKVSNPHFLSVVLKGDTLNSQGFGTKLLLYQKGSLQVQEQNPYRGYCSSVDQKLIFGLGGNDKIDSLVVLWPNDKKQIINNIQADTTIAILKKNALDFPYHNVQQPTTLFSDVTFASNILYRHEDNEYNDFANQRLLPQKFSQLGPFMAAGDINGDSATDFFIGGGFSKSGQFFSQTKNQSFVSKFLTDSVKMEEDMDCSFFDADSDGDADLLITYGDVIQQENSVHYKPRLFFNDGKGNFSLKSEAIPASVTTIAGCVSTGDYDKDGDLDIFIGGRVSKNYPLPPASFLLQNNKGLFTDVTAKVCPALQKPGMITAAVWTDFDNDKKIDLIIAGEWMPLRFFRNENSSLIEVTNENGLSNMNGMWRSLAASDIDRDGDMDIIAGNLGLNCTYHVSPQEPMQLFAKDLDGNGSIDPIFFYYIKDKDGKRKLFPGISKSQFADQVPAIKKQFLYTKDYAGATFDDIFPKNRRENLMQLRCDETRSCYFENLGKGKFKKHVLPMEAQFAPVNAIVCDDLNGDGYLDILLAGNEYQADVITGRYDASYGCFFKGTGNKTFQFIPSVKSGFIINGDVKDLQVVRLSNGSKLILAAVNNDSLRVFKISN